MKNKNTKSIRSKMKSCNKHIKDKTHILIECILNKDPLTANEIFPGLVSEAQKLRELEVKKLLLQDDEDAGDDDFGDDDTGDDDGGDDQGGDDDTGDDDGGDDDEAGDDEGDGSEEDENTDKVIDDVTEIKCQINAKVIERLFDIISDLKNALNDKELDETSKEFIVLDTTISYYSDKLQELQAQTNPGTDQTKLEEKLDTISKALDELKEKAGSEDSDSDDVEAPEDVDDSESDDEDEDQEDEGEDEDQEDEGEDEDQEDEGEDEDQDEDQQEGDQQEQEGGQDEDF